MSMSMRTPFLASAAIAFALALAACGGGDKNGEPTAAPTELGSDGNVQVPTTAGTAVPTSPPGTPGATQAPDGSDGGGVADSDLPQLEESDTPVERASKQLAIDQRAKLENVDVLSIAPMAWPDGCLGLGKPNEVCTQAVVPGFRIVLVLGDSRYTYRTDEAGRNVRLEKVTKTPNLGDDNS
jgi:hypothetical protein